MPPVKSYEKACEGTVEPEDVWQQLEQEARASTITIFAQMISNFIASRAGETSEPPDGEMSDNSDLNTK